MSTIFAVDDFSTFGKAERTSVMHYVVVKCVIDIINTLVTSITTATMRKIKSVTCLVTARPCHVYQ